MTNSLRLQLIIFLSERKMEGDFRLGEWLICPGLNTVQSEGASARIEHKCMQVLVCLANRPGDVVSKEELIRVVWADTFVTDEVLTRAISELRRTFSDDAKQPRLIETVPRMGYRVIAPIETGTPQPVSQATSWKLPLLVMAVVVFAA